MSFLQRLKQIIGKCEDTLFEVHSCLSCDIEIPDGSPFQLCKACQMGLDVIEGNVCQKCGEQLSDISKSVKVCDLCKEKEYHFDQNRSFCYYNDIAAAIVKKFKYSGKRYYAEFIARMMTSNSEVFTGIDVITYVPISKSRKRERGFNQAEQLAKAISSATQIPVQNLLAKKNQGKHQAGLGRADRLKNLQDSFEATEAAKKIRRQNVLIIDDVFTTGTTLDECAKVLRKFLPSKICTFTFAKTDFNITKMRN